MVENENHENHHTRVQMYIELVHSVRLNVNIFKLWFFGTIRNASVENFVRTLRIFN